MVVEVGVVDWLISSGDGHMFHLRTDLQEKCKEDVTYQLFTITISMLGTVAVQ